MCELLVKAIDAIHPDPTIDKAGCYKTGDVVAVREDNHIWGNKELDEAKFKLLKYPGVSVSDMQYLLNEEKEQIKSSAALKIPALLKHIQQQERKTINRTRYSIDLTTQQITDKARP